MQSIKCDLLIIGAGSGGLSLAAGASQMGADVVLLEAHKMGGDCLNYGCVPSKALQAWTGGPVTEQVFCLDNPQFPGVTVTEFIAGRTGGQELLVGAEAVSMLTPDDPLRRSIEERLEEYRSGRPFQQPDPAQ